MTVDSFAIPGTFTGPSGWLCPTDVFFVTVRLWGGGGGSGGGQNLTGAGAGGGGGAFIEILVAVTPGTRYDYQIGTRGSAGAANGGNAGAGGDSWFGSTLTALAKAGTGGLGKTGAAGTGGPAGLCVGTVKLSGGDGSPFSAGVGGAGGGSAGSGGEGGDASGNAGGTAGPGEAPGAAGPSHSPPSIIGPSPGAGASSGTANNASAGAQGGAGRMELTYEPFTAGLTDGPVIEIQDAPNIYVATGPSTVQTIDNLYEKSAASSPVIEKVWSRLVPTTLTITEPGLYVLPVPAGCRYIDFVGDGARGGQGGAISGTTMGGLGGAGGTLRGRILPSPDDVLYLYVGAAGAPGFAAGDGSFGRGGEPGGAGSSQNVFTHETEALGGTGGGWTGAFLNDELDPLVVAGGGGGGGAHGASGAAYTGGAGGVGGGDEAGSGENGGATNPGFYENIGFGGEGGALTGGGDGGFNSRFANGGAAKQGDPGVYLGGGATFRLGSYGTGSGPNAQGGGGAGGYFGGGAGGNGAVAGSVAQGGAGGAGGGCSFADVRIANVVSARGSNTGNDGRLVLTFLAPWDWVAPF